MSMISNIYSHLRHFVHERKNDALVRRSITHVAGPKLTKLAPDEVALVLLGRNVGYFLRENVAWHRAMGVRHIVYMDNGSTDDSIEIMAAMENTTVARCDAHFRQNQHRIRYYANTMFLEGGWRLAIDPDELLDYPGRERIDLPQMARYLSGRGFDAMVAHMLDMVPRGPLSEAPQTSFAEAIASFDSYGLEGFSSLDYHCKDIPWQFFLGQNQTSNPDIRVMYGGIRKLAFDEDCCLIKHPLFRMGPGVRPQPHPHVTTGVRCADFSAVLKHYKLAGGVLAREKKLLAEGRIHHPETALRVARLSEAPDIDLGAFAAHRDPTVEKLIEEGFLQITPRTRTDLLGPQPAAATVPHPVPEAAQ